jgi:hypothetical protein
VLTEGPAIAIHADQRPEKGLAPQHGRSVGIVSRRTQLYLPELHKQYSPSLTRPPQITAHCLATLTKRVDYVAEFSPMSFPSGRHLHRG